MRPTSKSYSEGESILSPLIPIFSLPCLPTWQSLKSVNGQLRPKRQDKDDGLEEIFSLDTFSQKRTMRCFSSFSLIIKEIVFNSDSQLRYYSFQCFSIIAFFGTHQ